jgi:hypothetical protein
MAAPIPEGTWIFILILAVIILAILSNDSISRSGSSSRSGSGSSSDSTDRPPRINAYHTGDEYIGGSFGVKGNFDSGSASNYDIDATLNGSSVDVSTDGDSFRTEEVNVQEGENEYGVKIQTSVGEDTDSGSFPATADDPESSRNPIVRVTEQRVDSDTGQFKLKAVARSRSSADIAYTGFVKVTHTAGNIFDFSELENSSEVSSGSQHVLEGRISPPDDSIAAGTVQYRAKTKDTEGRTGTYEDNFSFEQDISNLGSDGDGFRGVVDANVTYGSTDGHINDNRNTDIMGVIEHLEDGREITQLDHMKDMIERLEQFDRQEINELDRIQKIVAAAELSLQRARSHNVEEESNEVTRLKEIERDVAASHYLLNQLDEEIDRFKDTDQRMENLNESFQGADEKIRSEISELEDGVLSNLDDRHPNIEEVEAKVKQHYENESVQGVVNDVFVRAEQDPPDLPDIN